MIRSKRARLFAENFGARLAGIVIWPDYPLFEKKVQGSLKSTKNDIIDKMHALKFQGVLFLRSPKRRRQPPHRRTGLVKLSKIWISNRSNGSG